MKINMTKHRGGTLTPDTDLDAESMQRFATGETYEVEIRLPRNPAFHRKVFAFFNFCFEYWEKRADVGFLNREAQFSKFRGDLTCLAGEPYRVEVFNLRGEVRVTPKSLAYGAMSQKEFEGFYVAITNAAMRTVFKDCGEDVYNQLLSFF